MEKWEYNLYQNILIKNIAYLIKVYKLCKINSLYIINTIL